MKRKYFLQLIILFLVTFFPFGYLQAALTEEQAENWTFAKGQELLTILAEPTNEHKYVALDKILAEDIDLEYAAKFVVGKYWRTMTAAQQAKYVPLFKRYAAALYKNYPLSIPKGSIKFNINKTVAEKNTVNVYGVIFLDTVVENDDGFNVLFQLVENNGRPQVRDLKVEESSLLISFRDRFYKMIHQDNDDEIDWFLEDLEALVSDAENQHNR